jgi:hypothetical protein
MNPPVLPRLLVPIACFLTGIAVGFSLALSTEYWVKASDGMANLWGGIVGAGLGSALAVGGALYVQRQDSRERTQAIRNELTESLQQLDVQVQLTRYLLDLLEQPGQPNPYLHDGTHLQKLTVMLNNVTAMKVPYVLPPELLGRVRLAKLFGEHAMMSVRDAMTDWSGYTARYEKELAIHKGDRVKVLHARDLIEQALAACEKARQGLAQFGSV